MGIEVGGDGGVDEEVQYESGCGEVGVGLGGKQKSGTKTRWWEHSRRWRV